jgi:oxygen-independent coproporphyrinogen III oxidase
MTTPMKPAHLYVHVPFCARRCVYCDFAIAVRREVPVDDFVGAVERELTLRFPAGEDWSLDTLYFGGGTPSRLGVEGMRRLVETIGRHARLNDGAEVTIEANPDDVVDCDAGALRESGINRVSLGVQTFDDAALKWMHRVHDADAIPKAIEALRRGGFADISIDLIFSLPEMLDRDWRADLDRAIAFDPTHVSLYGLTIEADAPLGKQVARGDVAEAPEERYESDFLLAHEVLSKAGFEHYEVSNFAKPGHRARHNSSYWRGVAYAGIGPGAHEFDGLVRRWNVGGYVDWARRLEKGADPREGDEMLTQASRIAERVYLGLRTTDGLALDPAEAAAVKPWIDAGWAHLDGPRLTLTPLGWLRLDSLAADLTLLRSP